MFIEESRWIKQILDAIPLKSGCVILDIGSSTEYFRHVDQPFIDYYIFRPLRKRGATIVHVDARNDEGVDIVCDIADPNSQPQLNTLPKGDIVICANMLEHVRDREMVVKRLVGLTKPEGYLLITAPHVYRYHEDPIDTMYRPSNKELEKLFSSSDFQVIRSAVIQVRCGCMDVPEPFWKCLLLRVANFLRRDIFKREMVYSTCKVAAIVLQKKTG